MRDELGTLGSELLDESYLHVDGALCNGYAQLTVDDLNVMHSGSRRPGWSYDMPHSLQIDEWAPRAKNAPDAILKNMLLQSHAGRESPAGQASQAGQASKAVKPRTQVASIHRFAVFPFPFL